MKNNFSNLSRSCFILIALIFSANFLQAQVAINTTGDSPDPSAMLDVSSVDKGLLIPRLTTSQRTTLTSTAVAGLMVYDTNLNRFFFFNGVNWDEGSVGSLWSKSGSYTYLSNTTDFVGIGTTTPVHQLDVHMASGPSFVRIKSDDAYAGIMIEKGDAADNAYILYRTGTTNYWSVGMIGDNNFNIGTDYSSSGSKFFINSSGQVGIGTTTPGAKLEVATSSGEPEVRITRPTSSVAATLSFYTGSSGEWNFATASGNDNMAIYRGTGNTTGNLGLMYNGGNVGIGTLTPARTLEVVSSLWQSVRIRSTQSGAALEFVGSGNDWSIATWNNNLFLISSTNDFSSKTDEYVISTTSFNPVTNNTKTLGSSSYRWSTLYSGVGNFSSAGSGIAGATVHSENTLTTGGIAGSFETNGSDATVVLGQNGAGKFLKAFGPNGGNEEISIDNNGTVNLYNSSYVRTIQIAPIEGGGTTGGQITMYNSAGVETIAIDGDYTGDGRITTNELQITGGSDLSELFELSDYDNIQKGMVVIIDEDKPGSLKVSQTTYDRKVAGIVSGANNIKPGLIMSQKGTIADGEHLIALSGRVYCMVDASESSIKVGDMLTTSSVPGHAMKVEDFDKARGAIIGKAMTSLDSGKGLVLVLVSLQ